MVFALFSFSFSVYFSQDDFFGFKASLTDGTLSSLLKFFDFPAFSERGYAFYRPIPREVLHNLYLTVFGLNHFPMKILAFLLHLANGALTFLFLKRFFKNTKLSFFASLFFVASASNLTNLNYMAGGIEIMTATLFVLASSLCFLVFCEKKKWQFYVASLTFFVLAFTSQELSSILIFLIPGIFLFRRKSLSVTWLLPLFAVFGVYLYLDLIKIGLGEGDIQYTPVFSLKKIANSYAWYGAWIFGIPEMLVDFVGPGLRINPSLIKYWGGYFFFIFPAFLLMVFAGLSSFLITLKKKSWGKNYSKIVFLVISVVAILFPVSILPLHKQTYYVYLALPFFWAIVWYLVLSSEKKILVVFLALGFLVLTISSVSLGQKTYWAIQRGRIAERLLSDFKSAYPTLSKGAVVYVKNDPSYPFVAEDWGGTSTQASFVLNGSDAIQLVYNDLTVGVLYEDRDAIPSDTYYSFVARML